MLALISDTDYFKSAFDKAVLATKTWAVTKTFSACRLCKSCGGDYPNYGGEGLKKGDWGRWMMYNDGCQGSLTDQSFPPQLCCIAVDPPCQFCSSCGGEYSKRIGKKINKVDWGHCIHKGGQCSGAFKSDNAEFDICCRNIK